MVKKKNTSVNIETVFKNVNNVNQLEEYINNANKYEIQRMRSILLENERTGSLNKKLNGDDIKELLKLLDKKKEEPVNLFKTSDLRPLPFSKTVTVFDVYVTDEENWTPYVSPLATVGKIKTSSDSSLSDLNMDSQLQEEDILGLGQEEKKDGIFGLGIGGIF